jgi:hypothetical protein
VSTLVVVPAWVGKRLGMGHKFCPAQLKPALKTEALCKAKFGGKLVSLANGQSVSLASSRAPIENQGPTDSCPGHGTSQLEYTVNKANGTPLAFVPSPGHIYKMTRRLEDLAGVPAGQEAPVLTDGGAIPSYLPQVLGRYGKRAIQAPTSDGRYSDVEPSNVNVEPTVIELEEAGVSLDSGMYEIPNDNNADTAIQTALLQNIPTGTGAFVDTAFMSWTPNLPPLDDVNLDDPNGGGHWMSLDGASVTISGNQIVYELVSSWGTSVGDNGIFRVTQNWRKKAVFDAFPWFATPVQG